jgi:hypothetical protein
MTGCLKATKDSAEETAIPLAVTRSTETDETGSAGDRHCTEELDANITGDIACEKRHWMAEWSAICLPNLTFTSVPPIAGARLGCRLSSGMTGMTNIINGVEKTTPSLLTATDRLPGLFTWAMHDT